MTAIGMTGNAMTGRTGMKLAVFLSIALCVLAMPLGVRAQYTPDHPVVKEMVDRGVLFLSKNPVQGGGDSTFGIQVLTAYTIYKVEGDPDLPAVAAGIQLAKNYVEKTSVARGGFDHKSIYNMSVCCMLLASVSVDTFGPQLHKPDSADISQTQYVLLA